jgi:prefoldin subunit 5
MIQQTPKFMKVSFRICLILSFLSCFERVQAAIVLDTVPSRTYLNDFKPDEIIQQMEITIRTSADIFSETENDVWLDVGPRAWRLFGKFQRGGVRSFSINTTDIEPTASACISKESRLHVGDIIGFRLEKKGVAIPEMGGISNGPDDPMEQFEPDSVRADRYLKKMNHAVNKAQSKLDALQDSLAAVQALIDSFRVLDRRVGLIDYQLKNIPIQINFLTNELNHSKKLTTDFQEDEDIAKYIGKSKMMTTNELYNFMQSYKQQFHDKFTDEEKHYDALKQEIDTLQVQLKHLQLEKEAIEGLMVALEKHQTELYCHRGSIELMIANEKGHESKLLTEYNPLAEWANNVLGAIEEKDIPSKGQWKPEWMIVKINGRFFGKYAINERLKKGHSYWKVDLDTAGGGMRWQEKLLRSLRSNPIADRILYSDQDLSEMLRTPIHLSDTVNQQLVNITGRVVSKVPIYDKEGNAFFSVFVENMKVAGENFVPDGVLFNKQRYIQVKCNSYKDKKAKNRYRLFKKIAYGTRLRMEGVMVRNHVREGFLQLQPANATFMKRL